MSNITDDYDKITFANCTNNENNTDIIIPALLFTIQCGLSFSCLMNLMVYTLIIFLFNNK